ncbi:hypothetical protein AVCANL279_07290 [Campylobacter canadensis]|uniref:hypothetical protein n=1 Tax=Campylobacter canadensis TaxID=449520 RepID=UPI001552E509|nr:hypothetical protein [Campylobacter canadensis]MBZ7995181.1 hypothetical protein [Campylobacter canadensis]MBZ7997122.1 hypothetical protein [Campylobacter canadensis]MBZ8000545.1 hypothetical protein [Campylobacter canadensis]MBZ8003856.1 hypothetical protein [Campylobacter canadensis]
MYVDYIDFGDKEVVRVYQNNKLRIDFVFPFISKDEIIDDFGKIVSYKSKAIDFYKKVKKQNDIEQMKALYQKYIL